MWLKKKIHMYTDNWFLTKAIQGRKNSFFSTNVAGTIGYSFGKASSIIYLIPYKNQLEMDHKSKCKA